MIQQALDTTTGELETMYWIVEDSLYEGKKSRAMNVFTSLLYIARYRPRMIKDGLREAQRERIKELCQELFNGKSVQYQNHVTVQPAINPRKIPFKQEYELKMHLASHPDILSKALDDRIRIVGTEVETDFEYRCDIVAESPEVFYPIELKIAQGTHSAVSQCSKYCYYFYRKLRYDRYKKIQGVVIASGFDDWSVNELRRVGHWIFTIIPESDGISLERIL